MSEICNSSRWDPDISSGCKWHTFRVCRAVQRWSWSARNLRNLDMPWKLRTHDDDVSLLSQAHEIPIYPNDSQCSFQHLHQRCHCVFQLGRDSSYSGLCLCFLHSYAQCTGKLQWHGTLLSYRSIWCKVLIPDMLLVNINFVFFTLIVGIKHHFLCEGFRVFDRCLPICWCKGVGRGWVPNGSQHNGCDLYDFMAWCWGDSKYLKNWC